MIADMLSNKKLNQIVTELFIRRKNKYFPCFYRTILFRCSKKYQSKFNKLSCYKTPNKRELQQIAYNHSSDINLKDFMNLYKKCSAKLYSFLVIDTTYTSNNPSHFKKNLLERI